MDYKTYEPIAVEGLPAAYPLIFNQLQLTFTPPNDGNIVRTITGKSLQLVTARTTKNGPETPIIHAGYQKAIWDLREGHLRWCPSEHRLYRRDTDMEDHPGERRTLNSWHPVKSIEAEYCIDRPTAQQPGYSAAIVREAQRVQWFAQVERGVRIDPCVWVRRDGRVVQVRDEPDLAVTQTFDTRGMSREAVQQAERICRWLTVDEKSYKNLVRMFATPWLEPFKQLSYVLSGHGGDGKSLVLSQVVLNTLGVGKVFPAFNTTQFCEVGGFTLNRESMADAMDGMSFAYDDEAGSVSEDMLPALRALSTGTPMQARVQGGKYHTVTPSATIVLLTNQGFADSSESSDRRRFIKVEFHANNGRSYDEYHAIELFAHEHPAAFFALSCELWEHEGDTPEIVNLSPARQISDEMYWLITEIEANRERFNQPVASRERYRAEFHRSIDDGVLQLLGLKNATSKAIGPTQQRVVRVADWDRYEQYLNAVNESVITDVVVPPPAPIDGVVETPDAFGFACDYVRADARKVARDWKQLAASPNVDTSQRPSDAAAYAVVPREGYVVVDMDVPESGDTGWTLLNQQVGRYGSAAFPATYLVGTPSGGVHAYYRIPDMLAGKLKNAAHPHGMPIDLRVDGKGYVIGAGSHVESGDYRLLDVPTDDVPELSLDMCRWLTGTPGYVLDDPQQPMQPVFSHDGYVRETTKGSPSLAQLMKRGGGGGGEPQPDMTPIPPGSRNTDLHAWAYGRAINHQDNLTAIELDLYQRGRASGLDDAEIRTIWGSIMRQLNQHTK
ncbi:bifunctional DNA primase/polymerase [uncultured Bifidobacterium sp.]|uniref:bifunctional DNA primase/polymerase n=1 Tax=uncultured Bifidobacterium sp. TaxID=165187 RepID=UPI002587BBC9|nr:bifunctional DNA primase/polymerase [uncultured Bifidobacterium sp.]